jgi:hypothetical protein
MFTLVSGNSVIESDISESAHSSKQLEVCPGNLVPECTFQMARKIVSISDASHKTGFVVPDSGIYAVRHSAHLLPAEVTLMQGEIFPRCEACKEDVQFRLVRKLVERDPVLRFRVQLYQLPVLDQPQRKTG